MSGHAVPVDARGGPRCHSPPSRLVCAPLTPATRTPILGHAAASKWGNKVRKRKMERREGKKPCARLQGEFLLPKMAA